MQISYISWNQKQEVQLFRFRACHSSNWKHLTCDLPPLSDSGMNLTDMDMVNSNTSCSLRTCLIIIDIHVNLHQWPALETLWTSKPPREKKTHSMDKLVLKPHECTYGSDLVMVLIKILTLKQDHSTTKFHSTNKMSKTLETRFHMH
jgi:hypothetical protein